MKQKRLTAITILACVVCLMAACGSGSKASQEETVTLTDLSDVLETESGEAEIDETEGDGILTYEEAMNDYGLISSSGEWLSEADGFYADGVEIRFSDLTTYDALCEMLGELNTANDLDTSSMLLLVNATGYAAEDFSAEMEEQRRSTGKDAVTICFAVEGVDSAVEIAAVIDETYEMHELTVTLTGNESFTADGVVLIFDDEQVNVINGGSEYVYSWPAAE